MSHHSSENHDIDAIVCEHKLKELDASKFLTARSTTKKTIDGWYLPGVVVNSKVRQKLLGSYAEFLELGEDMDVHRKIAAKISRCHTILTSDSHHRSLPQAHDYCQQGLFCSFCINQRLQRIGEQYSAAVDGWRESRGLQHVQLHSLVFHPEWYNHNKRCSDVPRAFAAIKTFRERAGKLCGRLNQRAKQASQKLGPILWGVHCSLPKHTFEDQVVPMPHLHLCLVTGVKYKTAPLKESFRKLTEELLGVAQPDPGDPAELHKAIHYKKCDTVTFDDDPEVLPEAITDFAAYIARTVKVGTERGELLTALAGRAVQLYGGNRSSGILGIKGEGIRRRQLTDCPSPTFRNKALIYQRGFDGKEWYVRIYRNPACFAATEFDR